MLLYLYLMVCLSWCRTESVVPEAKEDENNDTPELLPPNLWRSDPPVIHENDTWWEDEGGEEEEEDEDGARSLLRDPHFLESTYGRSSSTCTSTRNCCPHAGTECHYVGGECHRTGTISTDTCDHFSTNPSLCQHDGCICCIDCDKGASTSKCGLARGSCRKQCQCLRYEYADHFNYCPNRACTCCRHCATTYQCKYGGTSPGVCLRDVDYYTRLEFVFLNTTAICAQPQCSCVNYCVVEKTCTMLAGYCIKKSVSCRPNYIKFDCGCRDTKSCSCCVPS
ncbi:hypothetical protein Pmani_031576 [Petrolisthes manimaculis]|uniref:Uncharacterized protein n=1 Tax=Petrolisthes manimaculis TaxID=1843537 RepID=A0AAE1NTH4_9EUCA|nr:hypothetical protein Pmani_031576 [Petrolisthes manimaculis]